jgi:thiamine-phosphate pyrophosphorylase
MLPCAPKSATEGETSGHAVAPNVQAISPPISMKLLGLYAVTPESNDTDELCRLVEAALQGGAAAIQYRHKQIAASAAFEQARRVVEVCRRYGRPMIVNDSIDLMLAIDAAGVHLGRDDEDPIRARHRIGAGYLIGVSCYDDFDRALRMRPIADYIAFGSVFTSLTKPAAVAAPLSLFDRARALGIPTVAIGGIDITNVAQVATAGADAVAVISGLFGVPLESADRVRERARELVAAFNAAKARA